MVRFSESLPQNVSRKIQRYASTKEKVLEIFNLNSTNLDFVIDILEKNNIFLPAYMPIYIMETEPFDWTDSKIDAVGAILEAEYIYPASNPKDDHKIILPKPHLGIVQKDKPVWVLERPKGHVVKVGEEIIISKKLLSFIEKYSFKCETNSVTYRGIRRINWVRPYPLIKTELIDTISFLPSIPCSVCGAYMKPRLGMWIAKQKAEFYGEIAEDIAGYDHLNYQHPIVLSCNMAKLISKKFKLGLYLEPIYSMNSPTAMLVKQVLEKFERLIKKDSNT